MQTTFSIEAEMEAWKEAPCLEIFPEGKEFESECPVLSSPEEKNSTPLSSTLGKRMEQLVQLGLASSKEYEIAASGLQIIQDGRTLGELDFVLLDHSRVRIVHLEIAYKIYVPEKGNSHPWHCWIGHNGRDRLVDKLEKLQSRQFAAWHLPETRTRIASLNLPNWPVEQKLCLKLWLYFNTHSDDGFPAWAAKHRAGGVHSSKELSLPDDCGYWIPPKCCWGINPRHQQQWLNASEADEILKKKLLQKGAQLLWIRRSDGSYGRDIVVSQTI